MRLLITDVLWPCAMAKWRIKEICHFAAKFETDIMVFKQPEFPIHVQELRHIFPFENYDILIFDTEYSHLTQHNSPEFDGLSFLGRSPVPRASYLLRLKRYRAETVDLQCYDVVYHIFIMCFQKFNDNSHVYPRSKQCIKLYPGGGFWTLPQIPNLSIDGVGAIVVTQHFVHQLLRPDSTTIMLPLYGAPFCSAGEVPRRKIESLEKHLCIAFCHIGNGREKGESLFQEVVEQYSKQYSDHNVRFISIGDTQPMQHVTNYGRMTQDALDQLYLNDVDIYINAESSTGVHGWPLGVEAMLQGCLLMTTDYRNDNKNNGFNFEPTEIIRVTSGDANEFVSAISELYQNRKNLFEISRNGQTRAFELFSAQKMLDPVENVLAKLAKMATVHAVRDACGGDAGGFCPLDKITLVCDLIDQKLIRTLVEIGVYRGAFLFPVSSYSNSLKTYGIDPYASYLQTDIKDTNIYNIAKSITEDQGRFDTIYRNNVDRILQLNLNCTLIRKTSMDACDMFGDSSIDLLHIDGCHDYQFVLDDITKFFPKIAVGGFIIIDDINWESVNGAFQTFVAEYKTQFSIVKKTDIWICIKKI